MLRTLILGFESIMNVQNMKVAIMLLHPIINNNYFYLDIKRMVSTIPAIISSTSPPATAPPTVTPFLVVPFSSASFPVVSVLFAEVTTVPVSFLISGIDKVVGRFSSCI